MTSFCNPNPCCPPPQPCVSDYQPLPISTTANGIDRCGNLHVYAAPASVFRPVHWPAWPIPFQGMLSFPGGYSYPGPMINSLTQIMTGGAAAAHWMIQSRRA